MTFQLDKKIVRAEFQEVEKQIAEGKKVEDIIEERQQDHRKKKISIVTEWFQGIGHTLNPFYSVPKTTKNKSPLTQLMETNSKETNSISDASAQVIYKE